MPNESLKTQAEEFSDISDLADPGRIAVMAVRKARYVRPTYYEDPLTHQLHIYDLDAGIADALLDSSILPAFSLGTKPAIKKIAQELFPNEEAVMERRRAKLLELMKRSSSVDQQG